MHETAFILNTATEKSLVIMDEVGRGTGTLDGVSIAWAVSEYLIHRIGCRTLFATHYHQLTTMAVPGMRNMKMTVIERDGNVSFPKRLEEGASSGSYGIHVARLAGLPDEVTFRASALESHFSTLERDVVEGNREAAVLEQASSLVPGERRRSEPYSDELFSREDLVIAELKSLEPDEITPLKALQILSDLVEKLKR